MRFPRFPRLPRFAVAVLLIGLAIAVLAWRPQWLLAAEYARLRWLAGAEVKSLTVADHRWAYLEAGSGPPLLLVHGFTGAKEHWLPLMAQLAGQFHVIAPDLPGWNASERVPGADYGVAAQAARLHQFIAALGDERVILEPVIQEPVILVGHSMGGQISGLLAADHPEQVQRLVLMASAGVPFADNAFSREVASGSNPFAVHNRAELHRQMAWVFSTPPFLPWPVDVALARQRAANAGFESAVLARIIAADQRYALAERLADIRVPVLLLWCRQDRVIDVSALRALRAGLADNRSVVLEGCGHMPMLERPNAVAKAIAAWP